jgi:hypothetical protein
MDPSIGNIFQAENAYDSGQSYNSGKAPPSNAHEYQLQTIALHDVFEILSGRSFAQYRKDFDRSKPAANDVLFNRSETAASFRAGVIAAFQRGQTEARIIFTKSSGEAGSENDFRCDFHPDKIAFKKSENRQRDYLSTTITGFR